MKERQTGLSPSLLLSIFPYSAFNSPISQTLTSNLQFQICKSTKNLWQQEFTKQDKLTALCLQLVLFCTVFIKKDDHQVQKIETICSYFVLNCSYSVTSHKLRSCSDQRKWGGKKLCFSVLYYIFQKLSGLDLSNLLLTYDWMDHLSMHIYI